MKKILLNSMILLSGLIFVTSCEDDDDTPMVPSTPSGPVTIAATVQNDTNFSILLDAVGRAGLVSVLDDANANLTVFAPNNAAFRALLQDENLADLDALENAITTEGLKNVLLYHVLGAKVLAADVSTGYATSEAVADMSAASKLSMFIDASNGVSINDEADVITTDIEASNGVIHVINAVLSPIDIYELISLNDGTFSSLDAALQAADGDLDDVLEDEANTLTVFAPDNAAFDALVQATPNVNNLTELVGALGTATLRDVLLYHVAAGNLRAEGLTSGPVNTQLMGSSFDVSVGSTVTITDATMGTATVTETNIQGTNGVVHKISSVILPQ